MSLPALIVTSLLELLCILFIALYWLIEMPAMLRFLRSLFPERRGEHIVGVLHEMGQAMGGFVRGTAIDAAAVGVLTYVGLTIIGLDLALTLSVLARLLFLYDVRRFGDYYVIYGSLAIVVILIFWAFIVAAITILGAEIASHVQVEYYGPLD